MHDIERPGLGPAALARVRAHVEAHLSDPMTLEDLAGAACISRFHFARLFRATTGSSPMAYVRAARVAAAKVLLAQSSQPISATAASLGFFDQSHFTRTFRRLTGMSPGHFTRQLAGRMPLSAQITPRERGVSSRPCVGCASVQVVSTDASRPCL